MSDPKNICHFLKKGRFFKFETEELNLFLEERVMWKID